MQKTNYAVDADKTILTEMTAALKDEYKTSNISSAPAMFEHTALYIKILLEAMLEKGVYADELEKLDLSMFISAGCLYDVGKISISDTVLNKPAKLTDEEFEIIKTHTKEGENIIEKITVRTEDNDFKKLAKLFAGYHHERWDGNGYPRGLKGKEIPIHGRIIAIIDVYDALVSERPYKKAFSAEDANRIIMEGSGKSFDPQIAGVFNEVKDKFKAIAV